MPLAQDLTLEQKAAALRKAHPAYAAPEVEAALLAHGGDVNATAAALVLGADARAEVGGGAVTPCRRSLHTLEGVLCQAAGLQVVLRRMQALCVGAVYAQTERVGQ